MFVGYKVPFSQFGSFYFLYAFKRKEIYLFSIYLVTVYKHFYIMMIHFVFSLQKSTAKKGNVVIREKKCLSIEIEKYQKCIIFFKRK